MLFGLLQFWYAQGIFGNIGLKPTAESKAAQLQDDTDKRNPFSTWQLGIIAISSIFGLLWLINSPASKISGGEVSIYSILIF